MNNPGSSVPHRLLPQVQSLLSSFLDSYRNRLWPGRFLVLVWVKELYHSNKSQERKPGSAAAQDKLRLLMVHLVLVSFAIVVVNMGADSYPEKFQQSCGHKSWQKQLRAGHGFRSRLPRVSVHLGSGSQLIVVEACAGGCSHDGKPGSAKTKREIRDQLQPSKICPQWLLNTSQPPKQAPLV